MLEISARKHLVFFMALLATGCANEYGENSSEIKSPIEIVDSEHGTIPEDGILMSSFMKRSALKMVMPIIEYCEINSHVALEAIEKSKEHYLLQYDIAFKGWIDSYGNKQIKLSKDRVDDAERELDAFSNSMLDKIKQTNSDLYCGELIEKLSMMTSDQIFQQFRDYDNLVDRSN